MKNENIHKEFADKEIRDFLAQELRETIKNGGSITTEFVEEQIRQSHILLKYAKNYDAIVLMIKEKGWDDWDISEHTPYDSETYFPFVGTEEEYNDLIAIIELEEDNK